MTRLKTCASCKHSLWMYYGLLCEVDMREAIDLCNRFEREPGSDEEERIESSDFRPEWNDGDA